MFLFMFWRHFLIEGDTQDLGVDLWKHKKTDKSSLTSDEPMKKTKRRNKKEQDKNQQLHFT
ncbi:hypothetical protein BDF14DRAFT_1787417 [Spinellus fusiger]|nr:hypothetical protein BDF14DRAFT_1787417 [Spinellus fusiger]